MKLKKVLAAALIGAMTLTTFGCGGGDADQGAADQAGDATAIKVGGTGPLTGGASIYGIAVQRGAEIAVEEVNALGGVQFELKMEDDAHDAEKAVNAYNALKDWGMQLSLNSVTTTPGIATSELNAADSIFGLTPSASGTGVTEGKTNVFQMCFADPNQGSASAKYISDQQLGTKIGVIYKNDDAYSSGIYETFKAEADALGLEIVSETTFTTDSQNDFSVQLQDAKNAGADLLFLPMYYDAASLILNQANAMDYAPKFFGVDGMDGILTLEGFDTTLAEGVMLLTPFSADADDERTKAFVAKYQELHGEVPNQFAADAYDCIYALYQACENAGATADMTAEELNDLMMKEFTSMTFDGLTGTGATWTAEGQVNKAPKGMVIQNGVYVGM